MATDNETTWESRELAARAREDAIQTQWDEYGRDEFRQAVTQWLDRDDLAISDDLADSLYDLIVARSGQEPEVSDAVTFVYDAATLDYCLDRDAVVAAATETASMVAIELDGRTCVRDGAGGVWWPGDDAAAEIRDAADPAATAVRICAAEPMRGEWRS